MVMPMLYQMMHDFDVKNNGQVFPIKPGVVQISSLLLSVLCYLVTLIIWFFARLQNGKLIDLWVQIEGLSILPILVYYYIAYSFLKKNAHLKGRMMNGLDNCRGEDSYKAVKDFIENRQEEDINENLE